MAENVLQNKNIAVYSKDFKFNRTIMIPFKAPFRVSETYLVLCERMSKISGVLIFDIKTGCQISKMGKKSMIASFTIHEESIYWLEQTPTTDLLSIYSMKTKILEEYILQVRDWGDWMGVINGDIFLLYRTHRKLVRSLVRCTRMHGRLEEREHFSMPHAPFTFDGYILSIMFDQITLRSLEGEAIGFSVNHMCVWNKEIWFCNSSNICLAKLN